MASRDSVNSHVSRDPDARMDKKKKTSSCFIEKTFRSHVSIVTHLSFFERIMARITDNNLRNLCESSETEIVST